MIRAVNQGVNAAGAQKLIPLWIEIPIDLLLLVGVLLLWRYTQTTPGKKLFKLRIVNLRGGGRPGWGRLFLRYLGYLVASVPIPLKLFTLMEPTLAQHPTFGILFSSWMFMLPLGLGFFWIFVSKHNYGWHDIMSGTTVIDAPQQEAASERHQ